MSRRNVDSGDGRGSGAAEIEAEYDVCGYVRCEPLKLGVQTVLYEF
jgi:hypothetical protein